MTVWAVLVPLAVGMDEVVSVVAEDRVGMRKSDSWEIAPS